MVVLKKFFLVFSVNVIFPIYANVEHKSFNIPSYLKSISGSQDEKTQLVHYIKKNGQYLDIGSGSDSVAQIIQKTQGLDYRIILGDLEPLVLKEAVLKHRFLEKHYNGQKYPLLDLKKINAINMGYIESNSLDGISASALLHEVFSYCPQKSSIDQFLSEVCRTLKEDGVFIYRDPAVLDSADDLSILTINSTEARKFFALFATKFLDRAYSNVVNPQGHCLKPRKHQASNMMITFKFKDQTKPSSLSLEKFLKINSSKIDFDAPFKLIAKNLFISEVTRHYLLFKTDLQDHSLIHELFQERISLNLQEHPALLNTILEKEVLPTLLHAEDSKIIVDPKMLTLLWKTSEEQNSHFSDAKFKNIFNWLNREGEEHYFYLDLDSLLTYVASYSLSQINDLKGKDYLLAPVSQEKIIQYPRPNYQKTLNDEFKLLSISGEELSIPTHKNVIHFEVCHKDVGKKRLADIAKNLSLVKLEKFVESLV